MTQDAIFSPFFATVFLTLIVWVYMYIRRISFITSRKLSQKELSVPGTLAQISPPNVSNPSDNLKNLFEIPIIFYALILYLFITNQVDAVYVNVAWIFVVFRALHSAVHCTFNLIILRFYLYLFSTLAVWFIAIRAAPIHFGT
ncbi:MAG: MAPEG family protein [Microcoleus anatoxicus]|uniref:MAPEG family protein n=1 Tax=Microcoleus anatoxicus TaxID=2705319 RepID=UPI00366EA123